MSIFKYISCVNSFENFYKNLLNLDNNIKGELFEQFSKIYIEICHPEFGKYYRFKEISNEKISNLHIPNKDKGIDAIIENENNNEFYSIQIKFRPKSSILNFGELSTYLALTDSVSTKFKYGIIITTGKDVCKEAKNNKYISITYSTLEQQCNSEFWNNFKNKILYVTDEKKLD